MSNIQPITEIDDNFMHENDDYASDLPVPVAPSHPLAPRDIGQLIVRTTIERLEASMRKKIDDGEMEQTIFDGASEEGDAQVNHYHGQGVYARSLLIPAGTAVVGKVHRQDRICIIAQGKCTFTDEFGSETVEAPWIGEFKAGTKTAVFAHTDTLWVACLGTDLKRGIDAVEELTCDNHAEYHSLLEDQNRSVKCLSE